MLSSIVLIISAFRPAAFMHSIRHSHVHGSAGPPIKQCQLSSTLRTNPSFSGLSLRAALTYKWSLSSRLANMSHWALVCMAIKLAIVCWANPSHCLISKSSSHVGPAVGVDTSRRQTSNYYHYFTCTVMKIFSENIGPVRPKYPTKMVRPQKIWSDLDERLVNCVTGISRSDHLLQWPPR